MSAAVDSPTATIEGYGERRLYWAMSDCWTIVRRGLLHLVRQPSNIAWQLGFPVVSVLLFGYVFGSAMSVPGGGDYREFLMPGMFGMTMAFGFMNTAYLVVLDKTKGITDRFRSMPMASSAVVTGRGLGDLLGACLDLVILALTALVVGWRPDGGASSRSQARITGLDTAPSMPRTAGIFARRSARSWASSVISSPFPGQARRRTPSPRRSPPVEKRVTGGRVRGSAKLFSAWRARFAAFFKGRRSAPCSSSRFRYEEASTCLRSDFFPCCAGFVMNTACC